MDAKTLRDKMAALPPMAAPSTYPRFTWPRRQVELRAHIKRDDPEEFLTWSTIHECLFVGDSRAAQAELAALREEWDYWWPAIEEDEFGKPVGMEACEDTSGNIVHQAYILKQWRDASGRDVKDLANIFEFGGGYGAMARLCNRLGFKGPHVIQDLPEFSYLQQYYLSNTGITNAIFTDEIWPFDEIEFDLFIAACSLSEIPFEERDDVLNKIQADNYLILYQRIYKERDNHRYFYDWAETMTDHVWLNYPVPHFPQHWYLVGVS